MLGSGRGLFLLGRNEKIPKNFRQVFSVVAESDTGHSMVCYHIPLCIMPLQRQLYICNSCDYDCDRRERLLTFLIDVT